MWLARVLMDSAMRSALTRGMSESEMLTAISLMFNSRRFLEIRLINDSTLDWRISQFDAWEKKNKGQFTF